MSGSGTRRAKHAPSLVRGRHVTQLDAAALEVVGRFVRVLGRCGYHPEAIEREVAAACRKIPKSWARSFPATLREMRDASHVLTLWFSDPAFLDAAGNPRALPLRGARASLEDLVRRVDRRISPGELLSYLLRMRALRVVHSRYVPRDRVLSLRGAGGPYNLRGLRGLLGMLRTLEHNGLPKSRASGWFEAVAENPRFPVSCLLAFEKRLRRAGNRVLLQLDADMHRREIARRPNERTIRLGVGMYKFEYESDPFDPRPRARRKGR
jgi:hypothetical protein